jgi:uncharacterized membrane protein YccC
LSFQRAARGARQGWQRFAAWLLPVGVDFRNVNLAEGLRAACAIGLIVAISELSGWTPLLWCPVAAFWTCMVDPGGSMRVRLPVMLTFVVAGALATGLGAYLAHEGLVLALPFGFLIVLVGGLCRIYGAAWGLFGNLLGVAATIALARQVGGPPHELLRMAMFLLGSSWAVLLSLVFWRLHPYRPARRSTGAVYKAMADLAIDLRHLIHRPAHDPALWSQHVRNHRGLVRAAIEAARQAMLDAARAKGAAGERPEQQIIFLEAADHIFNALIALSDVLELHAEAGDAEATFRRGDRLLRRIIPVLLRFADDVIEQTPAAHERLVHSIEIAVHGIAEPKDDASCDPVATIDRLAALIAARMRTAVTVVSSSAEPVPSVKTPEGRISLYKRLWAPIRANMNWRSLPLRHALRAATTVTVAESVALYFDLPYGYWLTITTLAVMQPDFATTWQRALERIIGTVIGAALFAAIGYTLHSPMALTLVIFPLALATVAFRTVNHSVFIMCLTPMFVLVMDLSQPPGTGTLELAAIRALNAAIGGIFAVLGCMVLWPSWEPARLPAQIAAALKAHAALAHAAFATVLDGKPPADLATSRRQAGLASTNLEAAVRRALVEPHLDRARVDAALVVVSALRRIAGALATLPFEADFRTEPGRTTLAQVAAWIEKALDDLNASAAKGASGGPSFAGRPDVLAILDRPGPDGQVGISHGMRTLSRLIGQIDLMVEAVAPAAREREGDRPDGDRADPGHHDRLSHIKLA